MAGAYPIDDYLCSQQRPVKVPTYHLSAELPAVTVSLDVLRDIMVELVAALQPDRAAGLVTALDDRLAGRMCGIEIDGCIDDAMVSDIVPVSAALSARRLDVQEAWRALHQANR